MGEFVIDGTLQDNACGDGFQPDLQIRFQAQLRRSDATGYWRIGDRPAAPGTFDATTGAFRFRTQALVEAWPADPANGVAGCRLLQTETIIGRVAGAFSSDDEDARTDAGTVDASASDAGMGNTGGGMVLSATNTIDIAASPGSDCSPALANAGGPFPALPCRATYALDGVASAP